MIRFLKRLTDGVPKRQLHLRSAKLFAGAALGFGLAAAMALTGQDRSTAGIWGALAFAYSAFSLLQFVLYRSSGDNGN